MLLAQKVQYNIFWKKAGNFLQQPAEERNTSPFLGYYLESTNSKRSLEGEQKLKPRRALSSSLGEQKLQPRQASSSSPGGWKLKPVEALTVLKEQASKKTTDDIR